MTWVDLPADTGFGLENLPYGIFATPGTSPRTGVAIGDRVLDLAAVTGDPVHATGSLNAFMTLGTRQFYRHRDGVLPARPCSACRSPVRPAGPP